MVSICLDLIALTPRELAMERLMHNLPVIAVLVVAVVLVAAVMIRRRRK